MILTINKYQVIKKLTDKLIFLPSKPKTNPLPFLMFIFSNTTSTAFESEM